jgi:VCBS repeat-containing protein
VRIGGPEAVAQVRDLDVLANDADVDHDAALSFARFDAVSTLGATISLNDDGTLHYDATQVSALHALSADQIVNDTFHYVAQDEHGALSNVAEVTVSVHGGVEPHQFWVV